MRKKTKRFLVFIFISAFLLTLSPVMPTQAQTSDTTNIEYFNSVMEMIQDKYQGEITEEELVTGALKGMFDTMDPYTSFYRMDEAETFFSEMEGEYTGVGIIINEVNGDIIISKVFPGSPAEKAGIVIGDKITGVDGHNLKSMPSTKAAELIRGEEGTKVTLDILKSGKKSSVKVELIRSKININPVSYEIIGDIGYIKLDIFNSNTGRYVKEALDELDKNNIKKVILDLRYNQGGIVEQAVSVAEKLVPEGLITKLDFKSGNMEDVEYYSKLKKLNYELVVLVNGASASASEILAGAIQDTDAGILIGTKTYGKSKVQKMIPLLTPEAYEKYQKMLGVKTVNAYDLIEKHSLIPKNNEVIGWTKITIGEYLTPKGRKIDQEGLTPDITVDDYKAVNGIDVRNIERLRKTSKPGLNGEGLDVFNAEKILKLSGYDVTTPDLKLDEKTFQAIKKFQKDNGLYPYGVLDFATQQAMNNKLEKLIIQIDKPFAKAVEVLSN